MKFYANENFPRPVIEELRALGHDVSTSLEAGNANRGVPDDDVLSYARTQARCLLTLNRLDFIRLPARVEHAGVVVCTRDADHRALALRVHDAVAGREDVAGAVIRVNRPA